MQQVILALSPRAARLLDQAVSWATTTPLYEEKVIDEFGSIDEAETCLSAIQAEIGEQLGTPSETPQPNSIDVPVVGAQARESAAEVIAGKMAKAARDAVDPSEPGTPGNDDDRYVAEEA